ncbi:glycoside hydrolase domain-containing protein [Streptomyces sp. NPDC051018]|uniref:glycoside hydrolase domain-containing protein n=1 Tax=Streptomyces sp. NPDC051018 TaxID=3365639 RepID=UPI0037A05948
MHRTHDGHRAARVPRDLRAHDGHRGGEGRPATRPEPRADSRQHGTGRPDPALPPRGPGQRTPREHGASRPASRTVVRTAAVLRTAAAFRPASRPPRPPRPRRLAAGLAVASTAGLLGAAAVLALAPSAAAEPATPVAYPTGATATRYSGLAFDTCTAPPLTAIRAWSASPYRAVGVYFGGVNRTCAQPQLTPSWVASVSALKWRLLPIYKGLQPPCGARPTDAKISLVPAAARSQGTAAATDAIARAGALGMRPGSAFYNDIEHYAQTDAPCRVAVLSYISSWTKELHRRGYVSGVYMNLNLGAKQLSDVFTSTAYARPDALWTARYDGVDSLRGWAGIPDSRWAVHQRAKQFRGTHSETYGGVTISIDTNRLDAPVATVAHPYTATSTTPLNARTGPSTAYPVARAYAPGAALTVVCQTPGPKVGTTAVWDKLADGTYVSDRYVSTPSKTTYSAPLPRCVYPYQTTATLTERSGPGAAYAARGTSPNGALAWVYCQRAGSRVGTTNVWSRLDTGRYVTDYYVANPSNTTYSKPVPRC